MPIGFEKYLIEKQDIFTYHSGTKKQSRANSAPYSGLIEITIRKQSKKTYGSKKPATGFISPVSSFF